MGEGDREEKGWMRREVSGREKKERGGNGCQFFSPDSF
jgi:hypothetical protein